MQCAEVMFRNDFTINNMKQDEFFFSVDFNPI